ncbi:MAG TPA: YafY family protein [Jatrophihabitans sp.]|nr:YafY family protein [Jatrophihabitans sp.]
MATTSSRTLRLLSLLQARRYWPGQQLADRLEVSLRTLRRDIDRLRELGYPVEAQPGVDGGYQLARGASLPPLVLDDEEAVAMAISLINSAHSSVAGVAEASVRALTKVAQVLPNRLQRQVQLVRAAVDPSGSAGGPGSEVEPRLLVTLAQACRDSIRLQFAYRAADGTPSARRVDPHRLVSLGRRWYLVGFDLDRHEWRTFRLDRLSMPELTSIRFAPRALPAEDAAAFVRAGRVALPAAFTVAAAVQAPAAAVRARIGTWATVTELDAGRCLVELRVDSLDWAVAALGLAGAPFEIRAAPPAFTERLRLWCRRLAGAQPDGTDLPADVV